jgi:predicted nucleotidyltransferase
MIGIIEQQRGAVAALCRRFHVRRLDVFGTAAKGGFNPEHSDLDFLVTLEAPTPGEYSDNYFGLAQALEALFQRRVDLITEPSIRNPFFRQAVEESRQIVYEA